MSFRVLRVRLPIEKEITPEQPQISHLALLLSLRTTNPIPVTNGISTISCMILVSSTFNNITHFLQALIMAICYIFVCVLRVKNIYFLEKRSAIIRLKVYKYKREGCQF